MRECYFLIAKSESWEVQNWMKAFQTYEFPEILILAKLFC